MNFDDFERDFEQALRKGDFIAAARAWASGQLLRNEGVLAFERKLAANLEDRQVVIGETITITAGEYEFLGDKGRYGARMAFSPADGSLDGIIYLRDQAQLLQHLATVGATPMEVDAVVAFYALSDHQNNERAGPLRGTTEPRMTAASAPVQQASEIVTGLGESILDLSLPQPLADFKKRLSVADWFYDYSDDSSVRSAGAESLSQLREDYKALMQDYPEEAVAVWRAEAPDEFKGYMPDFLPKLEAAVPQAIQAHKDHDLSEAHAQGGAELKGEDTIEQAVVNVAVLPKVSHIDAISRAANGGNAISRADTSKGNVAGASAVPLLTRDSEKSLLGGRFVLRDQGQYFRVADGVESSRYALVDEDSRIRFVDKQMDTFQAAIELAQHKRWDAILVTGSEKFRAEAWHHARMAGLEVVGYEPTEQDLATLSAAQDGRGKAGAELDTRSKHSLEAAAAFVVGKGYGVSEAKVESGRHVGKILHETETHIVQDVGRKIAVVHDKQHFEPQGLRAAVDHGKSLKIQYQRGKATIEGSKDRVLERGR